MTAIATGSEVLDITGTDLEVDTGAEELPRGRNKRVTALCLLTYAVLAVLVFLPVSPLATNAIPAAAPGNPAGSDPYQMTWFLAWFPYAVSHGLNIFHTNLIEYPNGVNLADNTTVPLLGLIGWPVTATLGPIATFNLLIRLGFALSGASMFFVLRRWCRGWIAPFAGGLLYAFGPYMSGQELHLDLIFVPIPPLLVWCADELLRRQKMQPWRLGLLIGAAASAQFLISPDVLSGCAVLTACAGLVLGIRYRHLIAQRLPYILRGTAFAGATLALILGWPLWEMVAGAGHLTGSVIPPPSLQIIRADLLGPIVPTSNQLLAPHSIAKFGDELVDGNLSENGTYLGLPLLILLVVIGKRLWRDITVRTLSWLVVGAFVLSLGNKLTIGTLKTVIPLPEAVFAHLPLLDNTIPARYALYVVLFVSMILAIGIDRLWLSAGAPVPVPVPAPDNVASTGGVGGLASTGGVGGLGGLGGLGVGGGVGGLGGVGGTGGLGGTEGTDTVVAPEGGENARLARSLRRWLTEDTPRAHRAGVSIATGIIVLSLIPSVPFLNRPIPWPTGFVATVDRVVPAGSVVLTYPYATPLHPSAMVWEAESGMRFHIMGGYANIQVGRRGRRWPALLRPAYVEELLGYSSFGDKLPLPAPVVPADYLLLRRFLTRYSVGAVVFWAGGDDRYEVYSYLRAALGPPNVRKHHMAIWLPVNGRWPGPE